MSVFAFLDSLFGLPAHPLVVHAAVVLVPLAAIGTIVIAVWPTARRRIGWIVAAIGVIGFFFTFLAKESGEALLETTKVTAAIRTHADMGTWGVIGAFLVGGSACSVMLFNLFVDERDRRGLRQLSAETPVRNLISVFAVVLSIFGTVLVINVGHSGAKATWENRSNAPVVSTPGGD
jgi:uncharacterized membrane protein